ncbi:hypothetical protein AB0M02_46285 [Actinoplanes sp. NPDC051861]|uniref:hypothetical protein n=1 Tax=Actinoplanes sp. NPDC051861 TaxID=3155170 RepID=UPI0034139784
MEIRLWSIAAEPEVLALAGPGAEVHVSPDAVLAVGRDTVVVVCERGVRTAEDLAANGPFPAHLAARLTSPKPPTLLAFARLPEGCLALGAARVIRAGSRRGALQDLGLYLEAPLPYDLLDRVRPTAPAPEQPGLGWLDLLPGDPLTALEEFVTGWYGGAPAARETDDPLEILRRIADGRPEIYGSSLRIYPEPADDGAFGQEHDGVFTLHTDESGHVWYHGLSDEPLRERERLGAYVLLAALTTAAMDSSPGGMAFVDRAQMKRIVAPMRRVALRPMRWPSAHSRFYAGPGIVVLAGDDGADWFEVYVGARHRSLLRRFRKLGLDWERFDG